MKFLFVVYDVTSHPYRIAAIFRDNYILPFKYTETVVSVAKIYNNAYILAETNDIGAVIIKDLYWDHEYENIIFSESKGRAGMSATFDSRQIPGIRMTKSVKRNGCSHLKSLVENDKLLVRDADLIGELSVFVLKGVSYEAEDGRNDDMVMCCVMFAWLVDQPVFKDETGHDIFKKLREASAQYVEEEITPFLMSNGVDDEEWKNKDVYDFEDFIY